jgi:hypothetical protein
MKALLLIIAFLTTGAFAADYKPLTGEYGLGGKTLFDPPANESRNSHMYFSLAGSAARDLYEAIKAKALRDECANDGSMSKRVGEMQCTLSSDKKEYRCWFGIDVNRQKIVNGVIC